MKKCFPLFLKALGYQLVWFLPLLFLGVYLYTHLSAWCDSYFGVLEMQQTNDKVPLLSSTSLFDSFRAFMIETTTSAKLYMLSSVSALVARLGELILDVLGLMLCWKLITKFRASYHGKKRDSKLVQDVVAELQPEIRALRQEINHLSLQLKGKTK